MTLRAILGVLLVAVAVSAKAQPIRVGSVAEARFGTGWTLDGGQMADTRAKLLNPANFGAGGIYSRPVTITDTAATLGSVDAVLLSQFDIFFIGYLNDGSSNAFTEAELDAFRTWVNNGGTMIVTCDEEGYDAVCAAFGHPSTTSSTNPYLPTGTGASTAIFNGPFGSVTSFNGSGTLGFFPDTAGATVLARDSNDPARAVMLVQNFGSGRVYFLGDVDIVANVLTEGDAITSPNDKLLGNLFAFASNPNGKYFVGSLQSGTWYNPAQSGHGVMLELLSGGGAWMCWFTFDLAGTRAWICGLGTVAEDTVDFPEAFVVTGGKFPPLFDASQIAEVPWGHVTLKFTSCDAGTLEWTTSATGFQSGSIPMARLTTLLGLGC